MNKYVCNDKNLKRALVNTVMEHRVPQNVGNFLSDY
jgi:hypothetical protein